MLERSRWPNIIALLSADLDIALRHNSDVLGGVHPSLRRRISVCLTPCMLVSILHRLAHAAWSCGLFGLAWFFARLNLLLNRIDIHPACRIAGGMYIPHPAGVMLRAHAGRDLVLLAGAGVCDNSHSKPADWPQICDDVWVAAGARVTGKLRIGDHARVGPGVILTDDLESETVTLAPLAGEIS